MLADGPKKFHLKQFCFLIGIFLLCLLVACGTRAPETDSSNNDGSADTAQQRWQANFQDEDGQPIAGMLITLEPSGVQAVTDETGTVELTSEVLPSADFVMDSSFGTARVSIADIPDYALALECRISVNRNNQSAEITIFEVIEGEPPIVEEPDTGSSNNNDSNEEPFKIPKRCAQCHEPRWPPRCNSKSWKALSTVHRKECK